MEGDEVYKGVEETLEVCSVIGPGVGESIGKCGRCEERVTAVGECIVVGAEADKGREGENAAGQNSVLAGLYCKVIG
ncbi:hypothetical protein FRX31_032618 [Thalictrum thalictroides]|uniref:Uncharacterized protein n=1 Tax=Thalictrum thalictroides TaxID=46969 RepID=A0A7J6V0K1_THATH|nr:hypothetical protein FRX31_032618 [Thalictrum thalictroides]